MVPFRKDAYEIVNIMRELVFGKGRFWNWNSFNLKFHIAEEKANVGNRKRFEEEFGDTGYRVSSARMVGEEFKVCFHCFRVV